jgi:uncharacterized protein HemX
MSDQIGFGGEVSAEPSQLLRAVESRLNALGTGVLARMDAQAQTASSASTAQPGDSSNKDFSGGSNGGSGVGVIVLTAVVAGAVGYLVGKKHKKKGPTEDKVQPPRGP